MSKHLCSADLLLKQLLVLHVALDPVTGPPARVCVCHHSPEGKDWKRTASVRVSDLWSRSAPQVGGAVLRTIIGRGLHKSALNGGGAGRKP